MTVSSWYFAYGSMTNPISLRRRDLHPIESKSAYVRGFKLEFNLAGGMANVRQCSDSVIHGVVHKLTPVEMERLLSVESVYDLVEVEAVPYGGNGQEEPVIVAELLVSDHSKLPQDPQLPSERYINIITQGLKFHGVESSWVQKIRNSPFRPSRQPNAYLRLQEGCPQELKTVSIEELAAMAVDDLVFAVGRKVIKLDCSMSSDHPVVKVAQSHMCGKEITYGLCMNLYDPTLPDISTAADVTEAHYAWAEDFIVEWLQHSGLSYMHLGWLQMEKNQMEKQLARGEITKV